MLNIFYHCFTTGWPFFVDKYSLAQGEIVQHKWPTCGKMMIKWNFLDLFVNYSLVIFDQLIVLGHDESVPFQNISNVCL